MKARLVESHRERIARIERERDPRRRPELLHRDRGLAADRRRRRRHPHPRPRGRARVPRGAGALARGTRRGRGRRGPRTPRRGRARRVREHHAGDDRGRQGGRDDRRVGRHPARGLRRLPRPDRRRRRRRARPTRAELAAVRARVDELAGADRPPAADPGRQAGPRRPLQRRRADRGPRPRRRHGGHLPGDPADAGADRRLGGPGGRRRGRPLDPLRLAPRADPRDGATAARAGRRGTGGGRRDHPGSPTPSGCARPGSPASTRRRTSTSTGSWARSSTSSRQRSGAGSPAPI